MKMKGEEEMITAILHDVVEDSDWTIDALRSEGFPENILEALGNLTKRDGEPYEAFIQRAKKAPLSRKVKLADLEDNMDMKRITLLQEKDLERIEKYHQAWLELKD
jgi:(p)ppGpp synthase/HD superfamily hydrolase